jgi:hypothetical protein
MSSETQVAVRKPPKPDWYDSYAALHFILQQSIETCADFFQGTDLDEDAIGIAKLIICSGETDEDTAERILMHMGYLTWLMADWKGLTPETVAKLKQIRDLVFPDLNFEN